MHAWRIGRWSTCSAFMIASPRHALAPSGPLKFLVRVRHSLHHMRVDQQRPQVPPVITGSKRSLYTRHHCSSSSRTGGCVRARLLFWGSHCVQVPQGRVGASYTDASRRASLDAPSVTRRVLLSAGVTGRALDQRSNVRNLHGQCVILHDNGQPLGLPLTHALALAYICH